MRRLLLTLVVVLCALAGAWAGPRLAGPATYSTAVADVQLRFGVTTPAHRGVDLYVPLADWGLRATVTKAPVRVRAEPRRIDRAGVVRTVTESRAATVRTLRAELDHALRAALIRHVLLALAGALGGGLVALLLWHLAGVRGRRLLLAPAGAVGLVALLGVGLGVWTATTFDGERLDQPSYYASGGELERLVSQADALRASASKYSTRVDNALRSVTGLLNGDTGGSPIAPATPASAEDTRRLVLASDVHNNVLTLPTLERYAAGAPVVLAGDFTINGGAMEAPLLKEMAEVSDTVVAVSGNHDSPGIMRALARRGVTVLDHADGVRRIAGIDMAGFEDPLAFDAGEFPKGIRAGMSFGDIPDGKRRLEDAIDERFDWFNQLPRRPQVLVVHQAAIARALAERIRAEAPDGPPLTILTAHTHVQREDLYGQGGLGSVTVVNSGTIGAGGIWGIGTQSVGFALLDLARSDNASVATDLISQNPKTGAASARRVVTDSPDCDGTLVVCHDDEGAEDAQAPDDADDPDYEPSATPSAAPSP